MDDHKSHMLGLGFLNQATGDNIDRRGQMRHMDVFRRTTSLSAAPLYYKSREVLYGIWCEEAFFWEVFFDSGGRAIGRWWCRELWLRAMGWHQYSQHGLEHCMRKLLDLWLNWSIIMVIIITITLNKISKRRFNCYLPWVFCSFLPFRVDVYLTGQAHLPQDADTIPRDYVAVCDHVPSHCRTVKPSIHIANHHVCPMVLFFI